jgi:ArsR family transcriptional regulator
LNAGVNEMLDYSSYIPFFKALSDETRLRIINMLAGGELCACELLTAFNITQPTLSYHMKILSESGLVNSRRSGAWTRYSLIMEKIEEIKVFLDDVAGRPDREPDQENAKKQGDSCNC